jgi:hypothetical protein
MKIIGIALVVIVTIFIVGFYLHLRTVNQKGVVTDTVPANRPIRLEELKERTKEEVVMLYGEPSVHTSFDLKDGVSEFRISLLNTYPPSEYSKRIEEYTWAYGSDEMITAWFEAETNGKPVSTLVWEKGAEF